MGIQIQNELNELLDVIKQEEGKPVWPSSVLPPSVINILWTFVTGKRIARSDPSLSRLLQLLLERSKAFDMSGGILNQMPWLRFIAPEKTGYNLLQRFNKELNKLFMATIEDHHATYTEEKSSDDLIYGYIKEQKAREHDPNSTFTNLQLTMIILDIFIAGSQTTSITIDLALMMMLVRPDIQATIHQEIDQALDNSQLPMYSDKVKLPYTEAVLLEVQRFFHIVPISGPRRATCTTTLGDYQIPKNTTVLISLRSVHMDPDYWGDPEVFRPERFLDADKRKIVNTERLLPFGLARRRCLGEALARSCIFTFFVGVLQRFDLMLPPGAPVPSIKLLPGITLSPQQYKIKFITR
jgi:cytochrome P450